MPKHFREEYKKLLLTYRIIFQWSSINVYWSIKKKVLKKCLKVTCIYKYTKEFTYSVSIWYIVHTISSVFKHFCNANNFIWANASSIIHLYNIKKNRVHGYMYYLKKKGNKLHTLHTFKFFKTIYFKKFKLNIKRLKYKIAILKACSCIVDK